MKFRRRVLVTVFDLSISKVFEGLNFFFQNCFPKVPPIFESSPQMSYFGLSSTSRVLSSSYVKLNQIFDILGVSFVKFLLNIFRTVP